jgi:hypothetical protein
MLDSSNGWLIIGFVALLVCLAALAVWTVIFIQGSTKAPISSPQNRRKKLLIPWLIWLAAAASWFMLYQLFDTLSRQSESGRILQCQQNLRAIGQAMKEYHHAFGRFPPAYLPDRNGRPAHSWRVLLLPYLDHEKTYKQYRFDEPWNSAHNWKLLSESGAASLFHCPADSEKREQTSYVMIVGSGTISDGPRGVRLKDITDGSGYTIMVVEMAVSDIHWAEPRDLKAEDMSYQINDTKGRGIRSGHAEGAYVLYCDGAVGILSTSEKPEIVKALTTIAGGEDVKGFFAQH